MQHLCGMQHATRVVSIEKLVSLMSLRLLSRLGSEGRLSSAAGGSVRCGVLGVRVPRGVLLSVSQIRIQRDHGLLLAL